MHIHSRIQFTLYLTLLATCASLISMKKVERVEKKECPYLPVILISGIDADQNGMEPMKQMIKKHLHPDVYVKHIEIGPNGWGKAISFLNPFDQANILAIELLGEKQLRKGFNIVAHSQGGIVSRYLIENYPFFPVHNYIALGSPQRGVFGIPGNTIYKSLRWFEPYLAPLLYTSTCQAIFSLPGYWNDTLRHDDYLQSCKFLPKLNNEIEHHHAALHKECICRLQNMVLVQSTNERVVEPPASCHFGFYKTGSNTEIEDLFDSEIYKNDTLGLKELYESKRLHLLMADCYHTEYQSDEKNFLENVLPFLKLARDEKIIQDVKKKKEEDANNFEVVVMNDEQKKEEIVYNDI